MMVEIYLLCKLLINGVIIIFKYTRFLTQFVYTKNKKMKYINDIYILFNIDGTFSIIYYMCYDICEY